MESNFLIIASSSSSPLLIAKFRELALSVANAIGEPVVLSTQNRQWIGELEQTLAGDGRVDIIAPASSAPMTTAPFAYRGDGRPDWAAMWTTFCELALYGGPPHRGEDAPLRGDDVSEAVPESCDAVWEIRRGIAETTGLYAKPYDTSWVAVMCESSRMAAWLCAAIILENVEAWSEGAVLFVPANASFRLKDEVKSVITVLAKTYHYWQQHVATRGAPDVLVAWDAHFH